MEKIKVAIAGLGSRGYDTYALISKRFPDDLQITAVADPDTAKIKKFKDNFPIDDSMCFSTAEELLSRGKIADVLFICTLDRNHYSEAITALNLGYDLLLEKPISVNVPECREIAETATRLGRKVIVCHVLRYTAFYQYIKNLIASGKIGEIVSIQACERVCYWHQAHSFVRGNWRNSDITSSMILQKCCHDMDIYLWLADKKCKTVSSFGSLSYFNDAHAPEGSSERCNESCSEYGTCVYNPYNYYGNKIKNGDFGWPTNVVCEENDIDKLNKALKTGQYGKCVFHTDNNVVDHQVVNLLLDGGTTINFTMCAFTATPGRTMLIMGTKGEINASMDDNRIDLTVFGKPIETTDVRALTSDFSGHGGGDARMLADLIKLIRYNEMNVSVTTIDRSVQSHYVAMAAEESRLNNGMAIDIETFVSSQK